MRSVTECARVTSLPILDYGRDELLLIQAARQYGPTQESENLPRG